VAASKQLQAWYRRTAFQWASRDDYWCPQEADAKKLRNKKVHERICTVFQETAQIVNIRLLARGAGSDLNPLTLTDFYEGRTANLKTSGSQRS
jgi:hypothetical protein